MRKVIERGFSEAEAAFALDVIHTMSVRPIKSKADLPLDGYLIKLSANQLESLDAKRTIARRGNDVVITGLWRSSNPKQVITILTLQKLGELQNFQELRNAITQRVAEPNQCGPIMHFYFQEDKDD